MNHQKMRMKVWLKAWCTTAGTLDTKQVETPNKWADTALKEFDRLFKEEEPEDLPVFNGTIYNNDDKNDIPF